MNEQKEKKEIKDTKELKNVIVGKLCYISDYNSLVFTATKKNNPVMYDKILLAKEKLDATFTEGYKPIILKEYNGTHYISITCEPPPYKKMTKEDLKTYFKFTFNATERTYKSIKRCKLLIQTIQPHVFEDTQYTEHISDKAIALFEDLTL